MGWCQGSIWKNALNHDYKNNYGRNFQFEKFSFIDFVLIDKWNLLGKRPNRPIANLSFADLHSQPREMLLPKPLNMYLLVFLFAHWFAFPFRKVWTGKEKENWKFEENAHQGSGWFTFCFKQYQTKFLRFLKHLNDLEHPTNYL